MNQADSRTFRRARVRPHRRPARNLAILASFHFALGLGSVAGFFSAHSILVSRFGPASLLQVYLWQGLVTMVLSASFYSLADWLGKKGFQGAWFLFLGGLVFGSWSLLVLMPDRAWVCLAVRALFDAVSISASLGYWFLVGNHFTHRGAKRHYSGLMGAYIVGDMAGGLLLGKAAGWIHSVNFILLWGAILVAAPLMLHGLKEAPGRRVSTVRCLKPGPRHAAASMAPVFSSLALLLFGFWLFYSFFSDATDYLFNTIVSQQGFGEDGLTAYFGKVALFANAGILGYHVFFSGPVLKRFGIDLTATIIPFLIAAAWSLAFFRPSLGTISLAQGLIYFFIEYLAITRLHIPLTVFSKVSRGRVKAVTEGFGRAGGFLLLFGVAWYFGFRPEFGDLARVVLVAACLFLGFPFLFRSIYFRHLLRALRSQERGLVLNAIHGLGERNKKTAAPLLIDLFRRSRRRGLRRAIVRCIAGMRSRGGMRAVLERFPECDRSVQRTIAQVCHEWKDGPTPSQEIREKLVGLVAEREAERGRAVPAGAGFAATVEVSMP